VNYLMYTQNVLVGIPIGKGAMNAPRYCELRVDGCSNIENSANTPRFSHPYGAMNFHVRVGIRFLLANSCTRRRGISNGFS
jgi:hypothetical protein